MADKRSGKSQGVRNTILNIVIVILTIIAFVHAAALVSETNPRSGYHYGPDPAESMIRMLERGRYTDLLRSKYTNEMLGTGVDSNSGYAVPYAAADYFEAAFNYNGYMSAGDTGGASAFKKKMDSSRTALGEYGYVADDIDEFLAK